MVKPQPPAAIARRLWPRMEPALGLRPASRVLDMLGKHHPAEPLWRPGFEGGAGPAPEFLDLASAGVGLCGYGLGLTRRR
jgi:hypothetical protein